METLNGFDRSKVFKWDVKVLISVNARISRGNVSKVF